MILSLLWRHLKAIKASCDLTYVCQIFSFVILQKVNLSEHLQTNVLRDVIVWYTLISFCEVSSNPNMCFDV